MINFKQPNEHLIKTIADNMRVADADEVYASHGHTPFEALMSGWKVSDYSVIVVDDDTPLTMFGLSKRSVLTMNGVPWMLSSEKLLSHRKKLLEISPLVVEDMLKICDYLENYVHSDNKLSIRWLKWLGFTIDEKLPYGVNGELFHRFYLRR